MFAAENGQMYMGRCGPFWDPAPERAAAERAAAKRAAAEREASERAAAKRAAAELTAAERAAAPSSVAIFGWLLPKAWLDGSRAKINY